MNVEARMLRALSLMGYVGMMSGLLALVWLHSLFSSSPIVIALQISALLLFFGRESPSAVAVSIWRPIRRKVGW